MKISYAITVCNEFTEIQKLIPYLLDNIRQDDEIVVLYDKKNGTRETLDLLQEFKKNKIIQLKTEEFNNHFSD